MNFVARTPNVTSMNSASAADSDRMSALVCMRDVQSVEPLAGGITNRNYRVTTKSAEFVVRVSDPESSVLAIDRHHEYENTARAAQAGAGPAVVEYLEGAGLLVVEWIDGVTFHPQDVANPANLPRVAAACRRLHSGPAFVSSFNMFDIQQRYLRLVLEQGFRLPDAYLEFSEHVDRIRHAFAVRPEPLVPCNNDTLAENFVDDFDRVWIIDYEYSGNNEASFELGNIWSESTLDDELLDLLVEAYWGTPDPSKIARARLWGLMSKYGWTLWASIQDAISPIEFDYWGWGMEKYERAVAEFRSPHFNRLLEQAT